MNHMDYYEFSNLVQNVLVEHLVIVFHMMPELYRMYTEDEPLSLDDTWGQGEDVRSFRALFGAEDLPPLSHVQGKHMQSLLPSRMNADDYRALLDEERRELFDELREMRLTISQEKGCAPYVIFSNKSLYQMCLHLPTSPEEFLDLYGVGPKNAAEYGEAFLDVIRSFAKTYLAE